MDDARVLYEVGQLPIFQNRMYDSEAEAKACPRGDVCLVEDLDSGLVYNAAFHPELMVYDANYQNEQAFSPLFQQHLESATQIVGRSLGRDGLVEVGCGKGYFLEMLQGMGFDVAGFDPTYEGTNPRIERRYFEPGVGITASGLILRHVLEHIPDPVSFLRRLRDANGGSGLIYIEVPCFEWICSHRAWFDIFYEHVNYFRLTDFYRMFDNVVESGRFFGGQYLYVVADLASLTTPKYDSRDRIAFPQDFLCRLEGRSIAGDGKTAIWGGASKGVIFALLSSRIRSNVDIVIDINPAKQGKYLPGSGLLVDSPEDGLSKLPNGSTIFVMNSNYLDEIVAQSGNIFSYRTVDDE